MNNKYIVPFNKKDTVDINDLYPILTEMTGLNEHEIFEALYGDDGNGSMCYIDDLIIEEMTENCSEDESEWTHYNKIYKAFEKLINEDKMPHEFYIYIWW